MHLLRLARTRWSSREPGPGGSRWRWVWPSWCQLTAVCLRALSLCLCCGCAQQVLSSVSASPFSHRPPFNQFGPRSPAVMWPQVLFSRVNEYQYVLQHCKGKFINPTLTSSSVWLFLWIPGSLVCSVLQNRPHLWWVKELPLIMMEPHQPIVRKYGYSHLFYILKYDWIQTWTELTNKNSYDAAASPHYTACRLSQRKR